MPSHNYREMKRDLSNEHDFVVRRRSPLWLQLGGLLIVAFGVLYLSSGKMQAANTSWTYPVVLVSVLGLLGVIGYIQVQRNRDLLLLTEFQNALFTSTARLNFRFCLIAKRDGSIVYYDPGFQSLFPHITTQSRSVLDDLFSQGEMPADIGQDISRLLQQDEHGVLLVPFRTNEGTSLRLVLHVDPLQKPKGYVAIRGREYVAHRAAGLEDASAANIGGTASATPAPVTYSAGTSATLMRGLLDAADVAAYAINPQGQMVYANAGLNQMLGYQADPLDQQQFPLMKLLYLRAGEGGPGQGHFEGETVFLQRNGNMVKYFLRQRPWTDDAGQILGAYGFLLPLSEANRKTNISGL